MKIRRKKKPNYERHVEEALTHMVPGSVMSMDIAHDNWCNFITGKEGGVCNCDPEVKLIPISFGPGEALN